MSFRFEPDRRRWDLIHAVYKPADCPGPSDMQKRVETGVTNGDCMAACLAATFQCLNIGYVRRVIMTGAAARMRHDLEEWIKEHWTEPACLGSGTPLHQLFFLAHDIALPEEERKKNGVWPEDPDGRLEKYFQNRVYMCEVEQLAFVCMMHQRGVNFLLRNWRATDPENPHVGTRLNCVPDPEEYRVLGIHEFIVVDFELVGPLDSRSAHYKLLNSASLEGLARAKKDPPGSSSSSEETVPTRKRRRIVEDLEDEDR